MALTCGLLLPRFQRCRPCCPPAAAAAAAACRPIWGQVPAADEQSTRVGECEKMEQPSLTRQQQQCTGHLFGFPYSGSVALDRRVPLGLPLFQLAKQGVDLAAAAAAATRGGLLIAASCRICCITLYLLLLGGKEVVYFAPGFVFALR